jgi:hypothetical protein
MSEGAAFWEQFASFWFVVFLFGVSFCGAVLGAWEGSSSVAGACGGRPHF